MVMEPRETSEKWGFKVSGSVSFIFKITLVFNEFQKIPTFTVKRWRKTFK